MRISAIVVAAAALLVMGSTEPRPVRAGEPVTVHAAPGAGPVTMLSYNVEGLPWPLTRGRTAAAAAIAAELRALHARGGAPQVVAVQEAFGDAQKAIGRDAGYRYAAFGPAADMPATPATSASDIAYLAAASAWHGETETPREDSGLAVFSDYPILWVKRVPFPRYACAGYDCLANKGMLAVALRVPGRAQPLIVVDTHLNSRTASGVDDDRSFHAYRRQVDALRGFVAGLGSPSTPLLLAGDFNVGNDAERQAYLSVALMHGDTLRIAASESACGSGCRRIAAVPSVVRAKTIVASHGAVATAGPASTFGTRDDGSRLSDHIGVMRTFDLAI